MPPGGIWWFLRDDAPAAVDLQAATQSIDTASTTAAMADAAVTDAAVADAAVAGAWSVDTSIGEFSYEDSTGTFVGFRVEEELSSIGSTTAVGRTPTGTITIDGTTLTAATIEAEMTAITTTTAAATTRCRAPWRQASTRPPRSP